MDFLFQKVDSRQLGILRIIIGSWFFIDMVSLLGIGYVREAYVEAVFNFHFYGFEWIKPLPGIGMYILFVVLSIISIAIILGFRLRLALSAFMIGYGYVFMCDIVYTLNKFYLFLILALVLCFTDAHKTLIWKRNTTIEWVPRWQIFVFQFLIGMIYTYSGISKINPDWLLYAEPLRFFLRNKIPFTWMSDELFLYFAYGFTYCGFIFDLSIVWLLINKKTNTIGHLLQVTFHSLNFVLLGIGSLSIFSIMLTALLFPSPWLKNKLKLKQYPSGDSLPANNYVTTILAFFLAVNLLIPHRHYLNDNNVNWTEKGHRFSWRLMTRTKSGSHCYFIVQSDQLKEPKRIYANQILTRRQYRKMSAETDLIITFGHYLRDQYTAEGHTNISVFVHGKTRLNGRPARPLVPEDLDLTKVNRSLFRDLVSNPISQRAN